MANFGKDLHDFKGSRYVHIRSAEQTEHYTVYIITVTVGPYIWTVKHRYSEFYDLHEKLTVSHKLDKTLLPPKKIFGNQTESFIKKRQRELEIYLQNVIMFLTQHIPPCLAYFLDFDKYEIHGITQAMAEDLYTRGEMLLQSREKYEVSTLQLYSLTERLKLPEPTCDSGDVKQDLGHILDYITRAKHLKVTCSSAPVDSSNIMMSKLSFDLTLFKSLQSLEICGCNFRLVYGFETVKQTVVKLEVHESKSSMREIFLQDAPHWKAEDGSVIVDFWNLVTELDLSRNSFSEINESIQLMPNVAKLNLSLNMIECIQNLHWLSQLTHLDLSHNNIRYLDSLHTKMGNITCLRLVHNQLECLHGFAKLFSLRTLDVSHNKITAIEELRYVCRLPCVEELTLEGNPVMSSLDYRTKTLQMFGDRVGEVVLDSVPPNQKELDTVAVLHALRKAKDAKLTKKVQPKSLSEVYSQSPSGSLYDQSEESRTSSPAHGAFSGSMPSNVTDWRRMDSSSNNQSPSPFSQKAFSYNSIHEGEDETLIVPEAYSYDMTQPPVAGLASNNRLCQQLSSNVCSDDSNFENTDNRYENTNIYLREQVPEAHPFDLTIENPASLSPSSDVMNSQKSVNNGQVSQLVHISKSQSMFPAMTTMSVVPISQLNTPAVNTMSLISQSITPAMNTMSSVSQSFCPVRNTMSEASKSQTSSLAVNSVQSSLPEISTLYTAVSTVQPSSPAINTVTETVKVQPSFPAMNTIQSSFPGESTVQSLSPAINTVNEIDQLSFPAMNTVQTSFPAVNTVQSASPVVKTVQSSSPAINTVQSSSPAISIVQSSSPAINTVQSSSPAISTVQSSSPAKNTTQSSSPAVDTAQLSFSAVDNVHSSSAGETAQLSSSAVEAAQLSSSTVETAAQLSSSAVETTQLSVLESAAQLSSSLMNIMNATKLQRSTYATPSLSLSFVSPELNSSDQSITHDTSCSRLLDTDSTQTNCVINKEDNVNVHHS